MQVEVWSDIVCPWCYIGKRRLERALEQFEHAADVEVIWKSFELDPSAPAHRGPTLEHLARKYGVSTDDARRMHERMESVAAELGLEYHLEETQGGNSFDAHRLLHLAKARGVQDAMKERLMYAYFTECRPVGDRKVLARLGEEVGLHDAGAVLASDAYAADVRGDEREARLFGISAVPFFVIDRYFAVEGAQPPELILSALRQAVAPGTPQVA